ncbi:MAG: hypothetical protein AB4426_28330 [Xenococcaceae cyanobacterium]
MSLLTSRVTGIHEDNTLRISQEIETKIVVLTVVAHYGLNPE